MKQVDKILRAYKLGEENAIDARGGYHAGNFKGAEKKAYQNGYKDGQKAVLIEKQKDAKENASR
jgi:hypothetical protein